jgi:RNA polymerase sigma-70 factor, ECF subfamily
MTVSEEFELQAEPFRRELLAYCYRMLGSVQDAEDLVQDTLLRAWRSYQTYDPERASLRTWLYRIATNACLTALDQRGRRALPADLTGPSADVGDLLASRRSDIPWLQPIPDTMLDPALISAGRESIRLAFVAALQHLPPRQRAVLLLRDVLAWPAAEVAVWLGLTVVAVNSALQRARERLAQVAPEPGKTPPEAAQRVLVEQYVAAFVAADVDQLARLLARDAILQMPPYLAWFSGRDSIVAFLSQPDRMRKRMVAMTGANGQPAVASFGYGPDGQPVPHSIHVLSFTPAGDAIARIDAFPDAALFPLFEALRPERS